MEGIPAVLRNEIGVCAIPVHLTAREHPPERPAARPPLVLCLWRFAYGGSPLGLNCIDIQRPSTQSLGQALSSAAPPGAATQALVGWAPREPWRSSVRTSWSVQFARVTLHKERDDSQQPPSLLSPLPAPLRRLQYTEFAAVDAGARFKQVSATCGLLLGWAQEAADHPLHPTGSSQTGTDCPPPCQRRLQGIGFAGKGAPKALQGWADKDDDDVIARNRRLFGGDRGRQVTCL